MKMMNPEEKKKLYKQIDEKTKGISHPTSVHETVDFIARGFPKNSFLIWKEDCIKMYNDIYWAKVWSDHLKAQAYDLLISSSIQKAEPDEEQDENENISLIGDGGFENG